MLVALDLQGRVGPGAAGGSPILLLVAWGWSFLLPAVDNTAGEEPASEFPPWVDSVSGKQACMCSPGQEVTYALLSWADKPLGG